MEIKQKGGSLDDKLRSRNSQFYVLIAGVGVAVVVDAVDDVDNIVDVVGDGDVVVDKFDIVVADHGVVDDCSVVVDVVVVVDIDIVVVVVAVKVAEIFVVARSGEIRAHYHPRLLF